MESTILTVRDLADKIKVLDPDAFVSVGISTFSGDLVLSYSESIFGVECETDDMLGFTYVTLYVDIPFGRLLSEELLQAIPECLYEEVQESGSIDWEKYYGM